MDANQTPEQGSQTPESIESKNLVVTQPDKLQTLMETLTLLDKVSESMGEDSSGDMGGTGTGGGQQGGDDQVSIREQAIANLPEPTVMKQQLNKYIENEVKKLRKEVRKSAKKVSKPGSAHTMNELYSRIRRLNGLLSELIESSYDVMKRLFIRVFIDKQTVN